MTLDVSKLSKADRLKVAALAERQLCEKDFYEFVRLAWHIVEPEMPFVDNWHIRGICIHLEAVADGRIKKLLINIPPGTMKSLLVCVFWPAWVWTTRPQKRFMFSSYAESLSHRDSGRCRDIIGSKWYQERWPLPFKDDQNTKGLFGNNAGGWRLATSVGGRGTGLHPDFNCFDDPHNVKEAESETERQGAINWWDGTMSSRGKVRNVAQVGVMQRLHTKDLSGHLLDKGNWEHICLPMRFEVGRMKPTSLGWNDPRTTDGELLWPVLYDEEKTAGLEIDLGPYYTAGQLQQRPSPRGGGMFKREWFSQIVPEVPGVILKWVRYWDKAGTKGGDGARTAGVLIGQMPPAAGGKKNRFIIADVVAGRWSSVEREAVILQTARTDVARFGYVEIWTEQEPGSGGKESAEGTVSNLAGFTCYIERVTGSKEVRAEPFAAQCAAGNVLLLAGPWNAGFIDEAELFPMGKLKDKIDAGGGAFNKMAGGGGLSSAADFAIPRRDSGDRLEISRLTANDM